MCEVGRVPTFPILKLPVVQRCPLATSGDQEGLLQSQGRVLSRARRVQEQKREQERPELVPSALSGRRGEGSHGSRAQVPVLGRPGQWGAEFLEPLEGSLFFFFLYCFNFYNNLFSWQ